MEVNYIAVFAAGLLSWALGALWYSPLLFGKVWQKELGFSQKDMEGANMPLIFGLSLVLMCIMAFGLMPVINAHGDGITAVHGAFHGALTGVFFALCSTGINYLYQRRSIKLFLIDGTYHVLFLALSGGLLAAWP